MRSETVIVPSPGRAWACRRSPGNLPFPVLRTFVRVLRHGDGLLAAPLISCPRLNERDFLPPGIAVRSRHPHEPRRLLNDPAVAVEVVLDPDVVNCANMHQTDVDGLDRAVAGVPEVNRHVVAEAFQLAANRLDVLLVGLGRGLVVGGHGTPFGPLLNANGRGLFLENIAKWIAQRSWSSPMCFVQSEHSGRSHVFPRPTGQSQRMSAICPQRQTGTSSDPHAKIGPSFGSRPPTT